MSASTSSLAAFGIATVASSLLLKARARALHTAPRCARRPHKVMIGKVGPQLDKRGKDPSKLIDPPIAKEDDLFWLRDDTRSNPEVLDHLRAENAYTAAMTSHLTKPGGPVDRLYEEFRGRMKETDAGVPYKRGPFKYYSRTVKGLSYPIHCRAAITVDGNAKEEEEVLLDENEVAKGHHMCDVHLYDESQDHGLLAYSVDFSGYETYSIHFRQLKNKAVFPAGMGEDKGHDLDVVGVVASTSTSSAGAVEPLSREALEASVIRNTNGDFEWGAEVTLDLNGKLVQTRELYYLTMDAEHRPYRLWRHVLGRPQEQDECLLQEDDECFWMGIGSSNSGDYLFVETSSKVTSEAYAIPLTARAVASLTKAGTKRCVAVKGAVPDAEEHEDEEEDEEGDKSGEEDEKEDGEEGRDGEEEEDDEDDASAKPASGNSGVPLPLMQLIAKREDNVLYEVEHYRRSNSNSDSDIMVINTNKGGVKNFKVAVAPVSAALQEGSSAWRDVLPHSTELYVTDVATFANFWVVSGRQGGFENVWIARKTDIERCLASSTPLSLSLSMLPPREAVYSLSEGGGNAIYSATTLRFVYSSPVTPTLSCEVAITDEKGNPAPAPKWPAAPIPAGLGEDRDPLSPLPSVPADGTILILKQKPVPNIDPSLYRTVRLWAPSRDGRTSIPVSLVIRPDRHTLDKAEADKLFSSSSSTSSSSSAVDSKCPLVEPAPVLQYAYGSYGYAMDPYFSAHVLSMADRGVIYAIAHIRGGTEMGRYWYEDEGKLLTKRNTFNDFIDVGDYLVKTGWAKKGRIAAQGGSAGGLLMGVVANERPDLWGAVLAEVPFVDVVTTMVDSSIPLTTTEWDEWGNPNEEPYYSYIKSYSPMDNVRPQAYPPMLIEAGLNDSRVAYWEPAKFAQRLRDANVAVTAKGTSTPSCSEQQHNTILLKTEMDEGHSGAADRYKYLKEKAFSWSWLLSKLGVEV